MGLPQHSMLMVELLHVLKIAPGRLWKSLEKCKTEYDAFDFCHYCTLKSNHIGLIPPLCVMNVHICPRVHWNRPPFEMDTGFSAIGAANATGSRYHFMCVEMR